MEYGIPFNFIEKYELKTDTSIMELTIGIHNFKSEKKNCQTNDDIEINRNNLIDQVNGAIIKKFNQPITI
ncbi:MAG TPA: hypothetical protein VLA13_03915 [Massilibacterium sp.]|nr:hypothetical protein [Massilibacterium sp.]